jgi:hypothetical protein
MLASESLIGWTIPLRVMRLSARWPGCRDNLPKAGERIARFNPGRYEAQ